MYNWIFEFLNSDGSQLIYSWMEIGLGFQVACSIKRHEVLLLTLNSEQCSFPLSLRQNGATFDAYIRETGAIKNETIPLLTASSSKIINDYGPACNTSENGPDYDTITWVQRSNTQLRTRKSADAVPSIFCTIYTTFKNYCVCIIFVTG